mgnify:CR=1 FL=1
MKKKRKAKKIVFKIFLLILVFLVIEFIASNTFLSVTKISVKDEKIPESFNGYKIVQLSDLHSKSFGKNSSMLIRAVKAQNPDIIVLTGDMVNSTDTQFDIFYDCAKELVKICDTYFIVGNHEQMLAVNLRSDITQHLKQIGVKTLDNKKVILDKNGEKINLYGLWFNLRYYRNLSGDSKDYALTDDIIRRLLGSTNNKEYNILLTHNPVYFDVYSDWGADLTLSGHIHGGMIRVPFVGGVLSPEYEFFPYYDAGIYENGEDMMFISRGLGNGLFGMRMFNHPEIAVLTLEKQ